jgi:hypothetical protein
MRQLPCRYFSLQSSRPGAICDFRRYFCNMLGGWHLRAEGHAALFEVELCPAALRQCPARFAAAWWATDCFVSQTAGCVVYFLGDKEGIKRTR